MANKLKYICSILVLALCFSLFTPIASAGPVAAYTPVDVQHSVFMIKAYQNGEPQWSGTGWKIKEGYLLTAGHVCDPEGQDGFTFRAVSKWNQEYPLQVVKFAHDPDLCLLSAPHIPGPILPKLIDVPDYGSTIWYSGAPVGVFGDGTVPFGRGFYIGGNKAMIAGYSGASGSPMYTEKGVFGVLVAGWRGTHLIVFEPASAVAQFLRE